MYKLIIIGASAGGKSSLMRHLRKHTKLHVVEMDEELVELNHGKWPFDNDNRNSVLVPKVSKKVLDMDNVVYISSYLPDEYAKQAKQKGFTIVLMEVSLDQLKLRNQKRMTEEKYESIEEFFDMQLEGFNRLRDKGLIDEVIDGHGPTEAIAEEIAGLID